MVDPVLAATTGGLLEDLARSLREAFFMFWATLWPLVLGFGVSGAVQAFVSPEQLQRRLGDHRPAAVVRASGLGMASSSCSYAASAMAKSLFQKGADFLTAMVFMFASTNLVIEMGIVLAVLLGWQFTAAEFVGGPIMIILLVALGGLLLRRGLIAAARRRVTQAAGSSEHDHVVSEERRHRLERQPWRQKLTSRAAWSDSATYTMADLTMLRKELVIGYLVAGFLAVLVPARVWNAMFVPGHGIWTSLENAVVGPVIAFLSFVCSIGNVPMAAALWKGGISFGGVISFIFADLLAAPLVLIYRRYYGGSLTLRLVAIFWAVMAAAGLAVEGIFAAVGILPPAAPPRSSPPPSTGTTPPSSTSSSSSCSRTCTGCTATGTVSGAEPATPLTRFAVCKSAGATPRPLPAITGGPCGFALTDAPTFFAEIPPVTSDAGLNRPASRRKAPWPPTPSAACPSTPLPPPPSAAMTAVTTSFAPPGAPKPSRPTPPGTFNPPDRTPAVDCDAREPIDRR